MIVWNVILMAALVAFGYRIEWLRADRDDWRTCAVARGGRVALDKRELDAAARIIRSLREQLKTRDDSLAETTRARAEAAVMKAHARETARQMQLLETQCAEVVTAAEASVEKTHALLSQRLVEVAP